MEAKTGKGAVKHGEKGLEMDGKADCPAGRPPGSGLRPGCRGRPPEGGKGRMNGSCRPTPQDVITIGAHSAEEILEALKREFAMERLAFEKLNPVTRGGFQREKEFQQKNGLPVRDWENICCYRLSRDQNSLPYYRYLEHRYQMVPVDLYVFHERNQGKLFSNCELLSIKLELMRGIGQAEADGETRAYRNYLYQANLFCKAWEQDHLSEESGETFPNKPLS